jgi:hypothetical protein
VGRSNYGVHYRPYLSTAESAENWLRSQKDKAKTEKEMEAWNRRSVVRADLDADKTTPDNVITFSDRARGKVKVIDGYELMPRRTKEINRAYYSQFPSAETLRKINDKDKRLLKAWYRKNPTQAQLANPFEIFVFELNPYQIIRDAYMALLDGWGININSKDNTKGQLAANIIYLSYKNS